nr:PREDICTED: dipeptidyl aminopeptidase-like protein 6 isoform X1 [Bemisia tabaci]XP_018915974.1 PREDICTED: dipeptidyl aminopeptidase-like protein 6 isoform X1 [Bemisia tabaci]XP_018915975.1 PREDICTED: dipeptidyl aminopeptidase-like protein 6 isoform X1 [Bemisia tabaci]
MKESSRDTFRKHSIKRCVTIVPPHIKEELITVTPNERNWRGICIALLVIVAVLGLILLFIVLLSPPFAGHGSKGAKFALEHIAQAHFKAPPLNGSWVSDSEYVYRDHDGGLTLYNAATDTKKVLMTNSTFRQLNAAEFYVSSDIKYVLLVSDAKQVYTNTRTAKYHVYEIATQSRTGLTPAISSTEDSDAVRLELVQWSPRGNALVFVYKHDIYYAPRARRSPPGAPLLRLTSNGSPTIRNGIPDWMYQEEIFKSGSGVWFSPDGRYLAYASFNDSLVGELKYPIYGMRTQYPHIEILRYPKAGTINPTATVWLVDLSSRDSAHVRFKKPTILENDPQEPYLINVAWSSNNKLAIVWLSRRQNLSVVQICSVNTASCEDSHTQRSEEGWLEPHGSIIFSPDGTGFMTLLPVLDGSAGYFTHVCHVNISTQVVTSVTHAQFVVTKLLSWDHENKLVYFEAAPYGRPGERHIYKVPDNTSSTSYPVIMCLTCPASEMNSTSTSSTTPNQASNETEPKLDLLETSIWRDDLVSGSLKFDKRKTETNTSIPTQKTNPCLFNRAHFSPNSKYYILECLGPGVPVVVLMDSIRNARLISLNNNSAIADRYAKMAIPQIKMFQVELESGFHAQVKLLLPPGLKEYEEMTFPLVLHVGGQPGDQFVNERWEVDWDTYLASKRNFIVARIDGRGAGFQGSQMTQQIYRRVGSVDVEDQLAVITYLKDNLKFIDRNRISVWGKGYGGFLATMILAHEGSVFKSGIAIAPIANFAHYQSFWTERIMGTPNVTDNYRGYEESDLTRKIGTLGEKRLLIIHGSADQSVSYEQSMLLSRALTNEDILFDQMTYPDEGNSLSGVQLHMLRSMEAFLDECFGPMNLEEWEEGIGFLSFAQ